MFISSTKALNLNPNAQIGVLADNCKFPQKSAKKMTRCAISKRNMMAIPATVFILKTHRRNSLDVRYNF